MTDEEILKAISLSAPTKGYGAPTPSDTPKGGMSDDDILKALGDANPEPGNKPGIVRQLAGATGNVATGAVKGIDDLFYGPIVKVLQQVDPDLAKRLYDTVNQPTAVNSLDPSAPLDYEVGKIIGQSAALGPIGPGAEAGAAARIAGNAALGAGVGGTELKDPEEHGSAVADMLFGAVGGATGGELAHGAAQLGGKIWNAVGASRMVAAARDAVDSMGNAPARLKAGIDNAYTSVSREASRLYGVRDAAGNDAPPVSSANIKAGLKDLEDKLEDSSVSNRIKPVLNRVKETLSTEEGSNALVLPAGIKIDPNTPEGAVNLARLKAAGVNLVPDQLEPNNIFAALTDVNKTLRSTKDPATAKQLRDLRGVLTQEVENISAQTGKSKDVLLAAHEEANDYFKENVVPFREMFGVDPNQPGATGKLTSKQVSEKIVNIFESGDEEKIAQAMRVVGKDPQGSRTVGKLMVKQALDAATKKDGTFSPGLVVKYFKDNEAGVAHLPYDLQQQIDGFGKLIKIGDGHLHIPGAHATASMLMFIGMEHALRGDLAHGAMLAGSGYGAMLSFRAFNKLVDNTKGRMFLSAAAKLPADSPRLAKLAQQAAPIVGTVMGTDALAGTPPPGGPSSGSIPIPQGQGGLTLQQMLGLSAPAGP